MSNKSSKNTSIIYFWCIKRGYLKALIFFHIYICVCVSQRKNKTRSSLRCQFIHRVCTLSLSDSSGIDRMNYEEENSRTPRRTADWSMWKMNFWWREGEAAPKHRLEGRKKEQVFTEKLSEAVASDWGCMLKAQKWQTGLKC